MLSRSSQTSFSSRSISNIGKAGTIGTNVEKRKLKFLTVTDRTSSLPRIAAMINQHATKKQHKPLGPTISNT